VKFAICNELFKDWDLEETLRFVSEVGYQGIEIAPFTLADSVDEISSQRRQQIRQKIEKYGLEVVGLHWLLVSPSGLYINHPDKNIRDKTKNYLLALIQFCRDLGGKIMVIGSPKQRKVLEGRSYEETWDTTREVFEECARVAQEKGVTLCIEPLPRRETNFITTAAEAIRLVKEIDHPNFRLILDVHAMSDEEKPLEEIISGAGAYLAHFHANDANKKAPGFGKVDFLPLFEILKKIDYRGYVSVEVFDFEPDPQTIARRSLEYMKKVINQGKES
jgi:sugar phosphate isomerase/epimerase